jgi:hypothetical protein
MGEQCPVSRELCEAKMKPLAAKVEKIEAVADAAAKTMQNLNDDLLVLRTKWVVFTAMAMFFVNVATTLLTIVLTR